MLSGYRLMWMLVMFDLPVVTKQERHAANAFRHWLLDLGFQRSQLSVYLRFCSSSTQLETLCKQVAVGLPAGGKVHILQITDKQYARTISYQGRSRQPSSKPPDQFVLF